MKSKNCLCKKGKLVSLFDEFCSLFGNRPGKVFILDVYAFDFIDEDLNYKLDNKVYIYQQIYADLVGLGLNLEVDTFAIEEFKSYIKFLSRCIDDNNRTPF